MQGESCDTARFRRRLGATENSRTPEQEAMMRATVERGLCPFDAANINRKINPYDYYVNPGWRVMENAWPYPGHAFHMVMPAINCVTDILAMQGDLLDWAYDAIDKTVHSFPIRSGGLVLRFGDFKKQGGTLGHLHFQLQIANLLSQAFITLGRPNKDQIDETVELLLGNEPQVKFEQYGVGSLWHVGRLSNLRPHVLDQFSFRPHRAMVEGRGDSYFRQLFNHVREIVISEKLDGGALVIRFGDRQYHGRVGTNLCADLIVADGTGPVLEVLHPAFNREQAMRSMDKLVLP